MGDRLSSIAAAPGQKVAFLAVGAWNTMFAYGIFVTLELAVGHVVPQLLILVIVHVPTVLVAYVLYRRFVFKVHGGWWRGLPRFWSVYLVALAVNFVLLPTLEYMFDLGVLVAQALVVGIVALASWFGHSRVSFRRPTVQS